MSSLIIANHVKEGVEMARQQKLPEVVVDIIRQHHGSSLITYFYQKARQLQTGAAVSEQDYRYPGPRPRSKVAAIVMLADAVGAASRTLTEPTPQRIQALTKSVITRIFLDDQRQHVRPDAQGPAGDRQELQPRPERHLPSPHRLSRRRVRRHEKTQ